jgi:hypothetical protein
MTTPLRAIPVSVQLNCKDKVKMKTQTMNSKLYFTVLQVMTG